MFQSTRPARGATSSFDNQVIQDVVSIHAPRTGRDIRAVELTPYARAVSIHAPRTGRDRRLDY